MARDVHVSSRGPAAVGPYSHGGWAGEMLFLSGQIPIQPETGALVAGDVATQTRQVLANLATVLGDAGLALEDIVKTTVFLVSMDDFLAMNEVYAELMPEPYPARSTIAVAALPLGARVEIEVVARRPNA